MAALLDQIEDENLDDTMVVSGEIEASENFKGFTVSMEYELLLRTWTNKLLEYQAVRKRLETLPYNLYYDVMIDVPVGLIPGKVVKTNEVMVPLGDNLFVKQSTFKAVEIIDRRIKCIGVENFARKLKKELGQFRRQLKVATESEDLFEIKVFIPGGSTEKSKESDNVKLSEGVCPRRVSQEDYDQLMKRLDYLEELENEEESSDESDTAEFSVQNQRGRKSVQWADLPAAAAAENTALKKAESPEYGSCDPPSILKNREEKSLRDPEQAVVPSPQHKVVPGSTDDGIIVENMKDLPYVHSHSLQPEIVACMSRVCTEVQALVANGNKLHQQLLGVQVLAGCNKEALAIASACKFDFVRAEGFIFAHLGDEGLLDACAGDLLRYRRYIDAEGVAIVTDIKKKHSSHSITSDLNIVQWGNAAEYFLSDGVVITGETTGAPASSQQLQELRCMLNIPILIGSGVTYENVEDYINADVLIIGSHFKRKGYWANELERQRIEKFMKKILDLRREKDASHI